MNSTGFSERTLTISATITIVSSVLSIIGGVLIILSYYIIKQTQNRVRDLLVALTVADIFTAFGNGVGSIRWYLYETQNSTAATYLCSGQSFVTTMSSMASFLWTVAIAVYLFWCVWLQRDPHLTMKGLVCIHIFIWCIPGGITSAAASYRVLGNNQNALNGVWCWLKLTVNDRYGILWMLMSGKGWEIFAYFSIGALYILMKMRTYEKRKRYGVHGFQWNQISSELGRENEIYCISFLILYCLRLWGTLRFILTIVRNSITFPEWYDESFQYVFLYLHSYGDSAQAFWNFILFCVFDKTVRSYVFHGSNRVKRLENYIANENERSPLL